MSERPTLVLASRSPQRRAILERLGVSFRVCAPEVDELCSGDPAEVALQNALRKARAGAREAGGDEIVLGVDTLVTIDGEIHGKPDGEEDARRTLQALSARSHRVLGGLALIAAGGQELTTLASTAVSFRELTPELLDWYLAHGEWRERAGAYAIQGAGAALVRAVEGDYENVVGLPVASLLDLCPQLI